MAVYVDDMNARYGRMVMCHMLADSTEELLAMADTIGVARKWIQKAGTPNEHFDVCKAARTKAVAAGAVQITWRQTGAMTLARRRAAREQDEGATCTRCGEMLDSAAKCARSAMCSGCSFTEGHMSDDTWLGEAPEPAASGRAA